MNSTIFSPNKLVSISKQGALFVFAALLLFFVTPVRATTLINPLPENSTTLFGFALAAVGDVNGDGVADLAVGEPFADGEFDGASGVWPPAECRPSLSYQRRRSDRDQRTGRSGLSNAHARKSSLVNWAVP